MTISEPCNLAIIEVLVEKKKPLQTNKKLVIKNKLTLA